VVFDVFVDQRAPIDGALFPGVTWPCASGETRVRSIDDDGDLRDDWEPAGLFSRVVYRDSSGLIGYWMPLDGLGPTGALLAMT
jgi:hypothetical protein